MFATLAETYMIAARTEPMIVRDHPQSMRITLIVAEREAKKARVLAMLRDADAQARRDAVRRFFARILVGVGGAINRLGNRLAPQGACCP